MPCPACNEPTLILEIDAIEIDHCPACGGAWLDAGELETIAQRAGAKAGILAALLAAAKTGDKGGRRCLRCKSKLEQADIAVASGPPIQIDRCPRGHGLWFDKGELKALIEAGAGGTDAEHAAMAQFFDDALRGVL